MRLDSLTKKIIFICMALTGTVASANAGAQELRNNSVYELRFPNLENKCLDVAAGGTSDGTNIHLWSCNNTAAQRFKLVLVDSAHFQLVNINSGKCVDIANGGIEDGTNVQLWSCNGSDAQAFRAESFTDGNLRFVNKNSNRCIDVKDESSGDGANVQNWTCNQSTAQKIQAVPAYADTMVESWNSAYLVQQGNLAYYRESLQSYNPDYFWIQALNIQGLEDAQIRLQSAAYREKIAALLHTFIQQNGNDWNWNEYNDDLAWAGLAFVRGYQITGVPVFLDKARHAFDLAYNRGWSNELGGGLWWDIRREAKEALSNNPNAILACYIYQATGNSWYRDRAVDIYKWIRNTIYDTNTGAVYRLVSADGRVDRDVGIFNVGTFIEAANCLQKVDPQQSSTYFDDAVRAIEYVKNNMTENGIIYPSSEFARGIGVFVRDNNLQSRYYDWMQQNSRAAWRNRRGDLGICWNNWTQATPADVNVLSHEAKNGVVMLQEAPF